MPEHAEIESPEFDEQAITDILVAIDDTLWGCGRERMDLIDGPTVDALRDAVKRELVAFAARSSPQGDDHEACPICGKDFDHEGYCEVSSPSRDGTVAVEDVVRWLSARDGAHINRVARADFGDDDFAPFVADAAEGLAREFLAEFGSARAGESNEGGNQ